MAFKDWGHFLTGGATTQKGRNFLFGEDERMDKFSQYTPEQENLFSQFINQLMSGGEGGVGGTQNLIKQLQNMLNPDSQYYKDLEEQQLGEFNEQTLPRLSEQFAGGAAGGALSSSGFAQALGGAGRGLQRDIQGQKSNTMMQALQQLLGQNQQALSAQPFGYKQTPASPGFLSQALGSGIKGYMGGM